MTATNPVAPMTDARQGIRDHGGRDTQDDEGDADRGQEPASTLRLEHVDSTGGWRPGSTHRRSRRSDRGYRHGVSVSGRSAHLAMTPSGHPLTAQAGKARARRL